MRIKKYLDISLQNTIEVEKAIEFNKQNNYEYILRDDANLIDAKCIIKLIRNGYKVVPLLETDDYIVLYHKDYNSDIETMEKREI